MNDRFSFAGFMSRESYDTSWHQVEEGVLEVDGVTFVLNLIRSLKFTEGFFLLAKVENESGTVLWSFKQEKFDGIGILAMADENVPVIALLDKGPRGKVQRVMPLSTLAGGKPIGLGKLTKYKVGAAEYLNRECKLTDMEERLETERQRLLENAGTTPAEREQIRLRLAERDTATAAQREADKAQREARRADLIRNVVSRRKMTVFTSSGQALSGFPVLNAEWPSLSNGVYVVRVDFIGKDDSIGNPIEHFRVMKMEGKNPSKMSPVPVTRENPVEVKLAEMRAAQSIGEIFVPIGDDVFSVQLYKDMDHIRAAGTAGLNGGTYVAVDRKTASGKYQVFSVTHGKHNVVGDFLPLQ